MNSEQRNIQTSDSASDKQLTETITPKIELVRVRVVSQHKGLYKILNAETEVLAQISGKYLHRAQGLAELPAVGDYVMVRNFETDSKRVIIEEILPRKSAFKRMAVGHDEQVQIIAANIDILFICMALDQDYNINRLERYISVAWDSGATPVIVLTKADLCEDKERVFYEVSSVALGVDILIVSNADTSSYEKLREYVGEGVTASFVGSSGVGKSTIVNYLLGTGVLATAEVRQDGKGRHTTTHRELFMLANGGALIDTPGMRELGIDSANLSKTFADIEELATRCRFSDCSHESEPGCAVRQALEERLLDERRFKSYRKLIKEMDYDGLNSKQIEEIKVKSMVGGFGEMKKARDYFKNKNERR